MRILLVLSLVVMAGCAQPLDSIELNITGGPFELQEDVSFDADVYPTEHLYTMHGKEHADGYTLHDLLFDWAGHSGHELETEWFDASFGHGYTLCAIDDFPPRTLGGEERGCFERDGYWAISVDGVGAQVGMSQLVIDNNTTVSLTWTTF